MGKIIVEKHKCVPEKIEKHWGPGTQWKCDCGIVWQLLDVFGYLVWQKFDYAQLITLRRSGMTNRKIYKLFPNLKNAKYTMWPDGVEE